MLKKVHWHRSINFGDCLTPFIFEKLTGVKPEFSPVNSNEPRYLMIGSIIDGAREKTIVWGTGSAWLNTLLICKNVDIRSVRGPLTRKVVINSGNNCPEIYGDPALLMPYLYKPQIEKKYKVGFIPHVIEREMKYNIDKDILFIDMGQDIFTVINKMLSCEKIISSSLHGLIVADAYNIPSQWIKLSDVIIGDNTKYYDHMLSINMEVYEPWKISINDCLIGTNIFNNIPYRSKNIDIEKIWNACPFLLDCQLKIF